MLARFEPERNRGGEICDEDEEEDLKRLAHDRHRRDDAEEDLKHLSEVHRHDKAYELLDARVYNAPLFDCTDDTAEVVVREDHVRRALGHLSALEAHSNANIGTLKSRRIVHSVARHGANPALSLERLDNFELVLRLGARKNACGASQLVEICVVEILAVANGAQHAAVSRFAIAFFEGARVEDVDVLSNGNGRLQIVARDHNHAHTSRPGLQHRILDTVALGVDGRGETTEC
mmetsp:Transcript_84769/g.137448  ORF Transcript_84769/g.137448 Transcript_84769/m.137448 type:complete len:233 (+) Transcript_84769:1009-1707(+)